MVDVCGRQKLVSVFLEMNDAVRNGYSSPTRFQWAKNTATGPTAAFSIGKSADGTLGRIPQYGEAGSFNCTVNYFTGACLRHFLR
jgi:hypothetical protein